MTRFLLLFDVKKRIVRSPGKTDYTQDPFYPNASVANLPSRSSRRNNTCAFWGPPQRGASLSLLR